MMEKEKPRDLYPGWKTLVVPHRGMLCSKAAEKDFKYECL